MILKIGKKIFKKLHPILKKLNEIYLSKPRNYSFDNIKITVNPGVFHPGLYYSTKIFLRFIDNNLPVAGKHVLELGCGSGLISIYLAKKGAVATASDISEIAVDNARKNAEMNSVEIVTIVSDLFEKLNASLFDFIFINPPYYPKNTQNKKEMAWFCGANFEYFHSLFKQLSESENLKAKIYMILSEDCNIQKIKGIAESYQTEMEIIFETKVRQEKNYIFSIKGK